MITVDSVEILFDDPIPKELIGLTFAEMMGKVQTEQQSILKKLVDKFGNAIWTPEAEAFLSEDEIMYLRLANYFANMSKTKIPKSKWGRKDV